MKFLSKIFKQPEPKFKVGDHVKVTSSFSFGTGRRPRKSEVGKIIKIIPGGGLVIGEYIIKFPNFTTMTVVDNPYLEKVECK